VRDELSYHAHYVIHLHSLIGKTAHKEVLTFARAPDSSFVGKEWEEIVMPIIERYGKFIRKYVQDMSATGTGALSTPITSLT
jgi:hypothetical protein